MDCVVPKNINTPITEGFSRETPTSPEFPFLDPEIDHNLLTINQLEWEGKGMPYNVLEISLAQVYIHVHCKTNIFFWKMSQLRL